MNSKFDRAEAYATSEQLGELFERTAMWLTLYGVRSGSRSEAYSYTNDGTLIYEEDESGNLDAIEKYEYDVSELIAKKLNTQILLGRVAVGITVDYVPAHYLYSGPERSCFYAPPICRFTTTTSEPPLEELLYVRKEATDGHFTSGRFILGSEDEENGPLALADTSVQSFKENMELEYSFGMLQMTAAEYQEYLKMISLLEMLK